MEVYSQVEMRSRVAKTEITTERASRGLSYLSTSTL